MNSESEHVNYEDFGARGDGVADDLPAICQAHAHANERGLPVRTRLDATYHLGARSLTAVIATDTDWTTSRFRIDDTDVPEEYGGIYLFTDPDAGWTMEGPRPAQRPFPYAPSRRVTLRRLQTASGRPPRVSPNPALNAVVEVVEG